MRLRAGETKEITPRLVPGSPFTAAEIAKVKEAVITIEAFADGILVGGMSYLLDPKFKPKPAPKPKSGRRVKI
jgi:hypothetical protein